MRTKGYSDVPDKSSVMNPPTKTQSATISVTVVTRGKYGKRAIRTIQEKTGFEVTEVTVPVDLPDFIEDTAPYTQGPAQALTSDLVIIFALHPDLTPAFA
ncbi:MAG: hypothetical protein KAU52_04575, partial [Methanosarcinales archaeon]|nr:hypothetical protein [Methanosarcinales archaeon]